MADAGPPPPGAGPPGGSPPPRPGPVPYGQPAPPAGPLGYGAGTGAAPAAPKKKRKVWPWILGVLVVLLLLMGGCVALVYRAATGPIDKANDFLSHIDDADFPAAFELTDPECFSADEYDQLESFFTEFELTGYDLTGTERFTGGGAATGTVTLEGAGERDVQIDLTNDDGWRVCGIDVTGN
jgi:hypothetical protein